jgi:hypothetical protein
MANENVAEQYLLDSLLTQISTLLDTEISTMESLTGLKLGSWGTKEIRENLENVSTVEGNHFAMYSEGENDYLDWLSTHVDILVPLTMCATIHRGDEPDDADQTARYICRAMENALRNSYKTAGAWHCGNVSTSIEPVGDDRNRRRAFVRATLRLRTTREQT